MRGVVAPPKEERASRIVGRMLMLIVLALGAGVAVYTATTNQRIELTEDVRADGLELPSPVAVNGLTINVIEDPGGSVPVVFLHDVDVTGGLTLAPLAGSLDDQYHGVRIDLPGFGYSDRLPFSTTLHTAAGMADVVSDVLKDRFNAPVIVVGVGYGGAVAAELGVTYPELVDGIVLVDTDFQRPQSFHVSLERLPWVGEAATYTWETGGRFALDDWAPYCAEGGWCPSVEELSQRALIITLEGTTKSLYEFGRTPEAALAPSNLSDIVAPVAYVWSAEGDVSSDTVDSIGEGLATFSVFESPTHQAQLEDYGAIAGAIEQLSR